MRPQLLEGLVRPGRRLGVHDRQQSCFGVCALGVHESSRVQDASPLRLHRDDGGSEPTGHFRHSDPEIAMDPDDRRVPGLQQVRQGCLHSRGSGSRDRERLLIGRAEDLSQAPTHVIEQIQELGIEVSQSRRRQRAQHA